MLVLLFIIFKVATDILANVSWWWILLALYLDGRDDCKCK